VSVPIRVAVLDAPPPALHSGRVELDGWLARHGLGATRAGSARVYLARDAGGAPVGYFALAAGSVDPSLVGSRTGKGMPRHPIPVVLLARLAVVEASQGRGVGRELVWYAASLALQASRLIAVRALVVDALDARTAGFYERLGFTPMEHDPLRLEVLIKDLEALAGAPLDPSA
jgi:GNAT superfamily N-acetyltransferase